MQAAIEKVAADDQSFTADLARGAAISHRDGSRPVRPGASDINRATCFAASTSSSARRPPTPAFPHDPVGRPRKRERLIDRGQGVSLSSSAGVGRARDDLRPAGDRHSLGGLPDGLPSGVQIIGPQFEDRTPLAFARAGRARIRRVSRPHPATRPDKTSPNPKVGRPASLLR